MAGLILSGSQARDLGVEVIPLDEFGGNALPGHPHEWNRYLFAWASVLLDRRDGEITRLPHLVATVFTLHHRVRPDNKYLGWDLRQHPLAGPAWSPDLAWLTWPEERRQRAKVFLA
jgi:hypothetical protein